MLVALLILLSCTTQPPMHVRGWKIYYGDGSITTSKAMVWEEAPARNVQVVLVFYQESYRVWRGGSWVIEPYRKLLHGEDYYWLEDGGFGAGNVDAVPRRPLLGAVKLGAWMPNDGFHVLYNQALNDMDF